LTINRNILLVIAVVAALLSGSSAVFADPGPATTSDTAGINPSDIQQAASSVGKETSIIPLPVYATSRNEGNDYGFMPVWLFKENEYIYGIFAPSVIYNDNTGLNLTLRYFGYPTVDKRYRLFLNQSIGVDHEATAEYWDDRFSEGRFKIYVKATYFRDSTYRFFGLGEASREEDEANYSNVEFSPEASLGYYLPHNLTLSVRERFRWVTIRRGTSRKLPYIQEEFPNLDGISGGAVLNSRLSLAYDSCAGGICPTDGWLAVIYGEANVAFTNSRFYSRIGLDVKRYFALDKEARFITVIKGALEMTGGSHVPFFERSTIGGENTLRGYGLYRFTDDGFILLNLEERIRLFKLHIYGVWSDWEVAPFVDIGRVYSSFEKDFFRHYKINPGVGFRAIVEPNVVGRVDLGYSDEGLTAFVGLDFPF
jgi:Omp85 superfamily domain